MNANDLNIPNRNLYHYSTSSVPSQVDNMQQPGTQAIQEFSKNPSCFSQHQKLLQLQKPQQEPFQPQIIRNKFQIPPANFHYPSTMIIAGDTIQHLQQEPSFTGSQFDESQLQIKESRMKNEQLSLYDNQILNSNKLLHSVRNRIPKKQNLMTLQPQTSAKSEINFINREAVLHNSNSPHRKTQQIHLSKNPYNNNNKKFGQKRYSIDEQNKLYQQILAQQGQQQSQQSQQKYIPKSATLLQQPKCSSQQEKQKTHCNNFANSLGIQQKQHPELSTYQEEEQQWQNLQSKKEQKNNSIPISIEQMQRVYYEEDEQSQKTLKLLEYNKFQPAMEKPRQSREFRNNYDSILSTNNNLQMNYSFQPQSLENHLYSDMPTPQLNLEESRRELASDEMNEFQSWSIVPTSSNDYHLLKRSKQLTPYYIQSINPPPPPPAPPLLDAPIMSETIEGNKPTLLKPFAKPSGVYDQRISPFVQDPHRFLSGNVISFFNIPDYLPYFKK